MKHFTPQELAERWAVSTDLIRDHIARGELDAIDVSLTAGGKARWRIPLTAIEQFERARSNKPPAPKPRRRRKAASAAKEWF